MSFKGDKNGHNLKLVNKDRQNDYIRRMNFCPYWIFRSVVQIQSSTILNPYSTVYKPYGRNVRA